MNMHPRRVAAQVAEISRHRRYALPAQPLIETKGGFILICTSSAARYLRAHIRRAKKGNGVFYPKRRVSVNVLHFAQGSGEGG